MVDETEPKTLYVGNLDSSVTEDFLEMLYQQFGEVISCKLVREHGNDPYAFVEFTEHTSAVTALMAMNKRLLQGREMKVNWASSPANQPKVDTSLHHHIFVGDLSPEIESHSLRDAFAPFGEISNCRIVRDTVTLKPKGYAFISFVNHADAENAIKAMNGQWLGSRTIKTNWSTRSPASKSHENDGRSNKRQAQASYAELYNESSPTNSTVYCGGFGDRLSQANLEDSFSFYGEIVDVKMFTPKGFAFIRFKNKEDATRAIEALNNTEIKGYRVRCYWGRETPNKRDVPTDNKSEGNQGITAAPENAYSLVQQSAAAGWYASQNYATYVPGAYYYQQPPPYIPQNTMLNYRMPPIHGTVFSRGWISAGYPSIPVPVPSGETSPVGYVPYEYGETAENLHQ